MQIFERGPRGVRVTARGRRRDRPRAGSALAARDLADTARQHSDPLSGTVRIGVIPTVCPYLLPEVAPSLRRRLPGLHVIWSEDKTQALVEQIERAALDGAIVALDDRVGQS